MNTLIPLDAELTERDWPIVIIGAGVIGLALGLLLRQRGHQVLLLESKEVAAGASRGNAGAFAFSDLLPLATPGIWRHIPKWLLDPLGPLSLRPSHLPELMPWLWHFVRASMPDRSRAATAAQAALMRLSAAAMPDLLATCNASQDVRSDGNLHLYDSKHSWAQALSGWQLREELGVSFEHVRGRDAIAAFQTGLSANFEYATFVPGWQTISDPLAFCQKMAQAFVSAGGLLRQASVQSLSSEASAVRLHCSLGLSLHASRVVVAAGPWSDRLARSLGDSIPLTAERGYNTTLPPGAFDLKRQLTFCDHAFVVTPINDGVRVGGAVELAHVDAPAHFARAQTMLNKAKGFIPTLNTEEGQSWMGSRPSLPDSLPALGPSPRDPRVLYAFGHGHLGLTQCAGSARILTSLIEEERPPIDLTPFRPARFTGSGAKR